MDKRNKSYSDYMSLDKNDKDCVYQFLQKYSLANFHIEKRFKKYFPVIYEDFKSICFKENDYTYDQLLYHYFHNDFNLDLGICKMCGKRTKFKNLFSGYSDFCSNDCQLNYLKNDNTILKRNKTNEIRKQKTKERNIQKKLVSLGFDLNKLTDKLYLFDFLKQHSQSFCRDKNIKKYFPEIYKDMMSYSYPDGFDFSQKLWHYLQDDMTFTLGKCKICGGDCTYKSFVVGYSHFCSERCYGEYAKNHGIKWNDFSEEKKNEIREKISQKNSNRSQEIIEKFVNSRKKNHTDKILKEKNIDIVEKKENSWVIKCDDTNCKLYDSCNKMFEINYQTLRGREARKSIFCTKINNPNKISTSQGELEVLDFIKSIYSGEIIQHDKSILNGKEIDIFIPEKNIGIEFNGIYWHSELYRDKNYHQLKVLQSKEKNIQLIQIWEDDWNSKKDIIKDILKSKFGYNKIIFARNCIVKPIDSKTSKEFLDKYHIQGNVNSSIRIGLFYCDELIEVITIGKLRNFMKSKSMDGEYELYRLCTKGGYSVVGGFSKLLKYFERNYNPNKIITFANLDFSYGDVYEKNGFNLEKITSPNYTWSIHQTRYNRVNFMKHIISTDDNKDLTESEIMHNCGYFKVYDSGNVKYIKTYNTHK